VRHAQKPIERARDAHEELLRRLDDEARLWMLLAYPHEAKQMAESLESEGNSRFEIWTFKQGEYSRWKSLVQENNDIVGEATETSMNLVINSGMFMTDLERIR